MTSKEPYQAKFKQEIVHILISLFHRRYLLKLELSCKGQCFSNCQLWEKEIFLSHICEPGKSTLFIKQILQLKRNQWINKLLQTEIRKRNLINAARAVYITNILVGFVWYRFSIDFKKARQMQPRRCHYLTSQNIEKGRLTWSWWTHYCKQSSRSSLSTHVFK